MIEEIRTELIFPNPLNPRKDLGDLSELVESIKARGVLQNLTLVPRDEGTYYIVIGHRRHEASKLAGLETVPCFVSDMDEKAQVETMMIENLQRGDLTVYEQAQGFQMMLDLGGSVSEISDRTGFSSATVRRRMKLLELDQQKLQKAEKRGATLLDFAELEKIEDPDLRDTVLATAGTENFRATLKSALDSEFNKKRMVEFEAALSAFAEKIEQQGYVGETPFDMNYVCSYGTWTRKSEVIERPEDADTVRYFYRADKNTITVYKERREPVKTEDDIRRDEARGARKRREAELQAISERHFELRQDYVRDYKGAKKHITEIGKFACAAIVGDGPYYREIPDPFMLESLLGVSIEEEVEYPDLLEILCEKFNAKPEYALLAIAYAALDKDSLAYWRSEWNSEIGEYEIIPYPNDRLDRIYGLLDSLGYEISDEERAMQNGTHELLVNAPEVSGDE